MKLAKIAITLISLSAILPIAVGQAPPPTGPTGLEQVAPIKEATGLVAVLENIVRWAQYIFFTVAAFMFILAAFFYLTAAGEEEKLRKAKNTLIYAVVATVIALLSLGFTAIIRGIVTTQ